MFCPNQLKPWTRLNREFIMVPTATAKAGFTVCLKHSFVTSLNMLVLFWTAMSAVDKYWIVQISLMPNTNTKHSMLT